MTIMTQRSWDVNWGVLSSKLVSCSLPTSPPTSHAFPQKTALPLGLIYDFLFFSRVAWQTGSQCPAQGWDLCPLQWKCAVLTTGPPEKSLMTHFKSFHADGIFQPSNIACFSSLGSLEGFSVPFFGCTGSALLRLGFLQLWRMGCRARWLSSCHTQASRVAVPKLSCPAACGIVIPWSGIKPTFSA